MILYRVDPCRASVIVMSHVSALLLSRASLELTVFFDINKTSEKKENPPRSCGA